MNPTAAPTGNSGVAQARYDFLSTDRDVYLSRAREASRLTIPSLLPPNGHTGASQLPTPFQSVGARGVNNLSSKLLLAQFPSNSPFFRMSVDAKHREKLDEDAAFKQEIDKALSTYERTVMEDIETSGDRSVIFETMKHLLVAGNVLLYTPVEGSRVFHLDRFVTRRDAMGNALEIVVKETFDYASLPENVQVLVTAPAQLENGLPAAAAKTVDVYTHILRKARQWFVSQEVAGQRVPDSEGQYPLDKSPWHPLRLIRIDGEDYGRGYVEEYIGDLKSLEALSKAIVEGSAAAAKVLFLVKPSGTTSQKTLAESPNGAIRTGNADDVTVVQLDKFADFRTARETMDKIEQRMAYAFLLNTAIQRSGERVTAEEIRYMAQELDDALGGIYSILSLEFQLPYVNRKIANLQRTGALPRLPKGVVRVKITTGLDALGRGHDRNKLVQYVDTLVKLGGAEFVASEVNLSVLAERLALADGIDTEGLLKTVEQKAQEQKAQQAQAMAQQATPEVVKQAGNAFAAAQQSEGQ